MGRVEVEKHVRQGAGHGEPDEQHPPLLVHHGRDHAALVVGAHHQAQQEDDQSGDRVQREALGLGRLQLFRYLSCC